MPQIGLMQKLAVSFNAALYYDYSESECFFISGTISTPNTGSNTSANTGANTGTNTTAIQSAFQMNAFQNNAFQVSFFNTPTGAAAFQSDAFQNNAFQVGAKPIPPLPQPVGPTVETGLFLVSPKYALSWMALNQAQIIYNPFQAGMVGPPGNSKGLSDVPSAPIQVG